MSPHIGYSPDERHSDQIAEQVARYRPRCMVELGDRHFHIEHDLRQHRHDDGLVVRRDEHADAYGYQRNIRRDALANAVQDVQRGQSLFQNVGQRARNAHSSRRFTRSLPGVR